MEACHELFWVFAEFYASWMQDAVITKSLVVHVLGGYNWLKNSAYFCIFKCIRTVKQKVWSKAGVAHFTCVRLFCCAKWFWEKKIWLLCSFFGGPSFRPESEIVQSCNHAYLTLLFLGMTLWATSWTVSLSRDVLRLMALFAASFVVISLIKRLDQSICPDFI